MADSIGKTKFTLHFLAKLISSTTLLANIEGCIDSQKMRSELFPSGNETSTRNQHKSTFLSI